MNTEHATRLLWIKDDKRDFIWIKREQNLGSRLLVRLRSGDQDQWLGELPANVASGAFRFSPTGFEQFAIQLIEPVAGTAFEECEFTTKVTLKAASEGAIIRWRGVNCTRALVRTVRWSGTALQWHLEKSFTSSGCSVTSASLVKNAIDAFLTPLDNDGRQGRTESIHVGPVKPKVIVTFKRGRDSKGTFAEVVVDGSVAPVRPRAVLRWQRLGHKSESIPIRWDAQGSWHSVLREIQMGDVLGVDFHDFQPDAEYYSQVGDARTPCDEEFTYWPLAEEEDLTERFTMRAAGAETTPPAQQDAEAETLQRFASLRQAVGSAGHREWSEDRSTFGRLVRIPAVLVETLIEMHADEPALTSALRVVANNAASQTWLESCLEFPQQLRLLAAQPRLLSIVEQNEIESPPKTSESILQHVLAVPVRRRLADAEIDRWAELLLGNENRDWLGERFRRDWLEMSPEDSSNLRELFFSLQAINVDELLACLNDGHGEPLREAAEEFKEAIAAAVSEDAAVDSLREANAQFQQLSGRVADHISDLLRSRPPDSGWTALSEMPAQLTSDWNEAVADLCRLTQDVCGKRREVDNILDHLEPPCWLAVDTAWLVEHLSRQEELRADVLLAATWLRDLFTAGDLPAWPPTAPAADAIDGVREAHEPFLEQLPKFSVVGLAAKLDVNVAKTSAELETALVNVKKTTAGITDIEGADELNKILGSLTERCDDVAAVICEEPLRTAARSRLHALKSSLYYQKSRGNTDFSVGSLDEPLEQRLEQRLAKWNGFEQTLNTLVQLQDDERSSELDWLFLLQEIPTSLRDELRGRLIGFPSDSAQGWIDEFADQIEEHLDVACASALAGMQTRVELRDRLRALLDRISTPSTCQQATAPNEQVQLKMPPIRRACFSRLNEAIQQTAELARVDAEIGELQERIAQQAQSLVEQAWLDCSITTTAAKCSLLTEDTSEAKQTSEIAEHLDEFLREEAFDQFGTLLERVPRVVRLLRLRERWQAIDEDPSLAAMFESHTAIQLDDEDKCSVLVRLHDFAERTRVASRLLHEEVLADVESDAEALEESGNTVGIHWWRVLRSASANSLVNAFMDVNEELTYNDEQLPSRHQPPKVTSHRDLVAGLAWLREIKDELRSERHAVPDFLLRILSHFRLIETKA